jgi:isopentenyl-diphosphate delta-isomerase
MKFLAKEYLIKVNKKDQVLGKVEKWMVHKKAILHRGFTVAIFCQNKIILQLRKHQIFDGYLDLTCSSHPLFLKGKSQNTLDAVYQTLKREWGIEKKDLVCPVKKRGTIIYKAKDLKSGLIEHEICSLYITEVENVPSFNSDFAYGFSLVEKNILLENNVELNKLLAPWVKKFLIFIKKYVTAIKLS